MKNAQLTMLEKSRNNILKYSKKGGLENYQYFLPFAY